MLIDIVHAIPISRINIPEHILVIHPIPEGLEDFIEVSFRRITLWGPRSLNVFETRVQQENRPRKKAKSQNSISHKL